MSTTSQIAQRLAVLFATAAALASAAPAHAAYGWPIKPFHSQHAVRAYFGDPRIAGNDEADGTFHFGIDIPAPDGTPVYATLDGVASIHPLHHDTVLVTGAGGVRHEYWHVIPAISPGERVVAYRTVVGHVEAPWGHVHFSEWRDGTYINPLRPGALEPYRDTTRPSVQRIEFERDGVAAGSRLSGAIDLVAEAIDTQPIPTPGPWGRVPVTPALVEWRLVGARSLAASGWHVAADFRGYLPRVPFASIYARYTRQNHGEKKRKWSGRYRFVLARGLDTRSLPNGTYRVVVSVADTAGNQSQSTRAFIVANGV
jgi:hypothetical protein